jgi:hypothetical protein
MADKTIGQLVEVAAPFVDEDLVLLSRDGVNIGRAKVGNFVSAPAFAIYLNTATTSAATAVASAAAALASETNAATSETNAATSESNALTSENNAAVSESNAFASASLSVASSTAAGISEANALNSSVTAQQSLSTMQGLTNSAQAGASSANLSAVTAQNFALQAQDTAIAISTQYKVFTTYRDAAEGIASLVYDQVFLVLEDERRNGKASFYQYQQADNPSLVLSFPDGPFQAGLIEDAFVFLRYQNPYSRPFVYSNFASVDTTQLEDGDYVLVDADETLEGRKTRYKFFGADYVTLSLNFDTGTYANGVATDTLAFDTYVDPQVVSVPATATSTGRLGEFAVDSDFLYVAVSANSWKRVALTTF